MPPLRAAARENAIGRLQAGQRQADVAHALNVSQSTISRLWNRFRQSGSTADAPRLGRPRVTTPAQDRFIRLRHLRNRFLSAQSNCSGTAWQPEDQQADSEKPYSRSWVEGLSTLPRECADETPPPGQDAVGKPTSGLDSQEPLATCLVEWRVQIPAAAPRRKKTGLPTAWWAICVSVRGWGASSWRWWRHCLGSHQQHRQESAGSSPRQPNSGTVHPGYLATACPAIDGHSRSCVPAG